MAGPFNEKRPIIIVTPWHKQFVKDQNVTQDEAAKMLKWAFDMVHVAATLYAACEK